MKNHIFKPAVWIIPMMLIVTGIGYTAKDKKPKPSEIRPVPVTNIKVTDQQTTVVPAAQSISTESSDTLFGISADWVDFSVGAIVCTSATYGAAGSFGDVNAGECSTATYGVTQGVAVIVEGLCCVVAGDANDDETVNISDAVFLINYIFKGGPTPPCLDEGDANCDGAVNVGDAVHLINYIFKGGAPPCCS